MSAQFSFSKYEKLKSVVRIDKLFTSGRSFWTYPFCVYYRLHSDVSSSGCQMLVSVGKRYFKHAVDRNRMKRLIREAFRLNRGNLFKIVAESGVCVDIGVVYKSKELLDYSTINSSMMQALSHLSSLIAKKENSK